MNVLIRSDGNEEIALGHLRRTLTIAERLREEGAGVCFLFSDEESLSFFERIGGRDSGFGIRQLGIAYGHPLKELEALQEILFNGGWDWLLVDSYAVDETYFKALRQGSRRALLSDPKLTRIAYIDDRMDMDPPLDLVINYDPDAQAKEGFYKNASCKLLGPSYAPLRAAFWGILPEVRRYVKKILISTGGSDPFGVAKSLDLLVQKAGFDTVVAAPGYPYIEDMALSMRTCDLAISAGGNTLYELCAAGVPTLSFSMTDNQREFAGKMAAAGACTYALDVREKSKREALPDVVLSYIRERNTSVGFTLRRQESAKMHALTDGGGARRIARAFKENLPDPIFP